MAGGRAARSWAVGDGREGRRGPAHRVLRSARTALEIECSRPVRKDTEPFGVAGAVKKSLCLYSMLFITDPFRDTGADSLMSWTVPGGPAADKKRVGLLVVRPYGLQVQGLQPRESVGDT